MAGNWLIVDPPYDRGEGNRPVFPYKPKAVDNLEESGYWEINNESDAADAVRDQVAQLGTDFDHKTLPTFCRFLVLLKTRRYKTIDALLFFRDNVTLSGSSFPVAFCSDVIIVATHSENSKPISDLTGVSDMCSDFRRRFSAADVPASTYQRSVIRLRPTLTKFGKRSAPEPDGYTLEMIIRGYGGSKTVAVERWYKLILMLLSTLEADS